MADPPKSPPPGKNLQEAAKQNKLAVQEGNDNQGLLKLLSNEMICELLRNLPPRARLASQTVAKRWSECLTTVCNSESVLLLKLDYLSHPLLDNYKLGDYFPFWNADKDEAVQPETELWKDQSVVASLQPKAHIVTHFEPHHAKAIASRFPNVETLYILSPFTSIERVYFVAHLIEEMSEQLKNVEIVLFNISRNDGGGGENQESNNRQIAPPNQNNNAQNPQAVPINGNNRQNAPPIQNISNVSGFALIPNVNNHNFQSIQRIRNLFHDPINRDNPYRFYIIPIYRSNHPIVNPFNNHNPGAHPLPDMDGYRSIPNSFFNKNLYIDFQNKPEYLTINGHYRGDEVLGRRLKSLQALFNALSHKMVTNGGQKVAVIIDETVFDERAVPSPFLSIFDHFGYQQLNLSMLNQLAECYLALPGMQFDSLSGCFSNRTIQYGTLQKFGLRLRTPVHCCNYFDLMLDYLYGHTENGPAKVQSITNLGEFVLYPSVDRLETIGRFVNLRCLSIGKVKKFLTQGEQIFEVVPFHDIIRRLAPLRLLRSLYVQLSCSEIMQVSNNGLPLPQLRSVRELLLEICSTVGPSHSSHRTLAILGLAHVFPNLQSFDLRWENVGRCEICRVDLGSGTLNDLDNSYQNNEQFAACLNDAMLPITGPNRLPSLRRFTLLCSVEDPTERLVRLNVQPLVDAVLRSKQ